MKTKRNVSEITPELHEEITQKCLGHVIKSQSDFNFYFKKEVEKSGFLFSEYQKYCREYLSDDFCY